MFALVVEKAVGVPVPDQTLYLDLLENIFLGFAFCRHYFYVAGIGVHFLVGGEHLVRLNVVGAG